MNYLAALLGIALMGAITTTAVYRADAIQARSDLKDLKASYATQAAAAVTHAQAIEAADLQKLNAQSTTAIQQATSAANQAQLTAATYKQKLAQLAGKPDLDEGHRCAGVVIPKELIP